MATTPNDLRDLLPLLEGERAAAAIEEAVAQELVTYATTEWGDYWASRGLDWVDQGVWSDAIRRSLTALSRSRQHSQRTRHRAWQHVKRTRADGATQASHAGHVPPVTPLPLLVIDGSSFDDFEGFAREFSGLLAGHEWRGNLDAFNDILRGGFGTPDHGFQLRWINSTRSRAVLGHRETIRRLEALLQTCHESNRASIEDRLRTARARSGQTLFEEIIGIVRVHGPGGAESEDNVHLELR